VSLYDNVLTKSSRQRSVWKSSILGKGAPKVGGGAAGAAGLQPLKPQKLKLKKQIF
jgi:hypothetical protein